MERRSHERRRVWLPAQVDQLKEGMAITHDASPGGVLMVAASTVEIGAEVDITLQIPPSGQVEHQVKGRVVRVEKNASDPLGMWPYRIAVEFDQIDPELEPIIEAIALKHEPDS